MRLFRGIQGPTQAQLVVMTGSKNPTLAVTAQTALEASTALEEGRAEISRELECWSPWIAQQIQAGWEHVLIKTMKQV